MCYPTKVVRGLLILLSILTAVGLGSSGAASVQRPLTAVQAVAGYDGETLFRGLFFGSGPAANLFQGSRELPGFPRDLIESPAADALEDRVVERLRGQDPAFFTRFGTNLQSGNHLRIEQALDEAGRHVSRVLSAELGVDHEDFVDAEEGFAIWREIAHFAITERASFIITTQTTAIAREETLPFPLRADSSLQREMWINTIAGSLRSAATD